MLDGMSPELRDAFEQVVNSDDPMLGTNVNADIKQLRANLQQRETTKANGGFAGSFTRSSDARYTADDIKSSIWGRIKSPFSSEASSDQMLRAKNWWLEGNPEMQERSAFLMNRATALAGPWLNAQEAKGMLIQNKAQLTKALVDGGWVVSTETGPAVMNPQVTTATLNGYKAVSGRVMSKELYSRTLDVLKEDYYNRFKARSDKPIDELVSESGIIGGLDRTTAQSEFDIEDVVIEADGSIIKVYAYKNGALVSTPVQKWGVSHLHERAMNIEQADQKKAKPAVYVNEAVVGKTSMPISKELSSVFKGGLATSIVSTILDQEGNTGTRRHQPDAKNRPEIVTVGPGIRVDGKYMNEPERAAVANAKTKEEYDAAVNKFMVKYYKGFDSLVASAGLPSTDAATATNSKSAHVALAAAHWQGGGQEYAKILNKAKTDLPGALADLSKSSLFVDVNKASNGKAKGHRRLELYHEGIMAANRAATTTNVLNKRGITAFTKPSYPLTTSPEGW